MSKNHVIVDLEQITNSCFVVMPFHSLFEAEYEKVIRPAIEAVGLKPVRGDEIYTEQDIVQDIWKYVRQARVIVAELSTRNPNVLYEVGLAHAIGKPIVLLTRKEEDVPFDLKALRYLFYDPNNPSWGENLRVDLSEMLRKVLNNPSLAAHLRGVDVQVDLPEKPTESTRPLEREISERDFSGTWETSWLSIRSEREHKAHLVIPRMHERQFMASMTIWYTRDDQQTIVQESLSGSLREDDKISLSGVSYTYIERGNSISYSLDSFELKLSDDGKSLNGKALLKYGTREVSFMRLSAPVVSGSI